MKIITYLLLMIAICFVAYGINSEVQEYYNYTTGEQKNQYSVMGICLYTTTNTSELVKIIIREAGIKNDVRWVEGSTIRVEWFGQLYAGVAPEVSPQVSQLWLYSDWITKADTNKRRDTIECIKMMYSKDPNTRYDGLLKLCFIYYKDHYDDYQENRPDWCR